MHPISAPDILATLKARYARLPYEELQAAAAEQMRITELRLAGLMGTAEPLDAQARVHRRADQVRVCGRAHVGCKVCCRRHTPCI